MGHTVWSQRRTLDVISKEIKAFSKSLRSDERILFEEILAKSYLHVGSITYTSSMHTWAFLLLSIILEQEKKIQEISEDYERLASGRMDTEEVYCAVD